MCALPLWERLSWSFVFESPSPHLLSLPGRYLIVQRRQGPSSRASLRCHYLISSVVNHRSELTKDRKVKVIWCSSVPFCNTVSPLLPEVEWLVSNVALWHAFQIFLIKKELGAVVSFSKTPTPELNVFDKSWHYHLERQVNDEQSFVVMLGKVSMFGWNPSPRTVLRPRECETSKKPGNNIWLKDITEILPSPFSPSISSGGVLKGHRENRVFAGREGYTV